MVYLFNFTPNIKDVDNKINIIPVVNNPKDRFEMAVMIAKNYKGNYLEIGAGSGIVAATVQENYTKMVLTEISNIGVKNLRKIFINNKKFNIICHDIENDFLDYDDNYFDIVVIAAVIEHLIDPLSTLKKIYSKIKPEGILILDTPNIAKWTNRIKLLLGRFPSTASHDEGLLCYDKKTPTKLYDEGHLHYFTFRSISKLLRKFVGFKRIRYYGYGSLKATKTPFFLAKLIPQLFSDIFIVAHK